MNIRLKWFSVHVGERCVIFTYGAYTFARTTFILARWALSLSLFGYIAFWKIHTKTKKNERTRGNEKGYQNRIMPSTLFYHSIWQFYMNTKGGARKKLCCITLVYQNKRRKAFLYEKLNYTLRWMVYKLLLLYMAFSWKTVKTLDNSVVAKCRHTFK